MTNRPTGEQDDNHGIRPARLCAGERADFAFLEAAAPPVGEPPEAPDAPRRLHRCPECRGQLVYPLAAEETTYDSWLVTLRCPSCERLEIGVFAREAIDAFDVELDRGTEALVDDLEQLTRANLAEEIDLFAAALEADAILPMDF